MGKLMMMLMLMQKLLVRPLMLFILRDELME
jgi:hypothetical protein